MRRAATVLATVFPLLLVQPVASAAPEAKLCTSDVSRGAVPHTFVLDACVDGSNVVLHNKLDVPVTVAVTGDAKAPAGAHPYDSPSTAVLRVATAPDTGRLPGGGAPPRRPRSCRLAGAAAGLWGRGERGGPRRPRGRRPLPRLPRPSARC